VNGTRANQPAWALEQTGSIVSGQPLTVSTSSFYTEYAIGVTDCAIDIESVDIRYSSTTTPAPEPGTFVLVGIALIGLGMTVRKRKG
jgi:PEP-CTERM motif-containing protein